jgi:hypothetical protein
MKVITMSYALEKHPTLPVVIRRYDDNSLNLSHVDPKVIDQSMDLINSQKEKVYYLIDVRELHINLDDILKAGGMASNKEGSLSNPNIIETLVVVPNRLVEMAAQGLRTATFGHLRIRPFRSVEEALAYVEQQLKSQVS